MAQKKKPVKKKVAKKTTKKTTKRQTKKKTVSPGRPPAYRSQNVQIAAYLCRFGATDENLAECLGVTERTINRWKKDYPEFCQSIKQAKAEFDDEQVVRALHEVATGYSHKAHHFSNYKGEVSKTEYTKRYPPNVMAIMYWLNNRSEDWNLRRAVQPIIVDPEPDDSTGVALLPGDMSADEWSKANEMAQKELAERMKEFAEQ
jgi:uncharacterized protein YhfF